MNWAQKEVLFTIKNAFNPKIDWFSLGFSQRGFNANSDLCYFNKGNKTVIVSIHTYIKKNLIP